jgi:hypothetical protein
MFSFPLGTAMPMRSLRKMMAEIEAVGETSNAAELFQVSQVQVSAI